MLPTTLGSTRSSPRHLALEHARESLRALEPSIRADPHSGLPELEPGEQQLFSSFQPRLKGGNYTISVEHDISYPASPATNLPKGELSLPRKVGQQDFEVIAPRFSLPPDAINSVYPPQGYDVQANTLPHIVLNDPLLPWSRNGSASPPPADSPNSVPWLALLLFTANELVLTPQELAGPESLFKRTRNMQVAGKPATEPVVQSSTLAVDIRLDDLRLVDSTTVAIAKQDDDVEKTQIRAIFVKKDLFGEFVRAYPDGKPADLSKQDAPDVSRYQYLSHVKRISAKGMAEAGAEVEKFMSVVLSHRAGPLGALHATPMAVHLVSIEDIESMRERSTWPLLDNTRYVALPSLYSWSYSCLPPGSFDVYHAMQQLGDTVGFLKADESAATVVSKSTVPQAQRITSRLRDGYTICRHRTQTGEITAAIIRGALTPNATSSKVMWETMSSSGSDLQILDEKLGLLDITYSTAWQLGKAQALADQGLCASLSRLRTVVHVYSMNRTKAEEMTARNAHTSRDALLDAVRDLLPRMDLLHDQDLTAPGAHNPIHRWQPNRRDPVDLSFENPAIREGFSNNAPRATMHLATSLDGEDLYNELNAPYSTDWMVVLTWVMDKLYLHDIPAQYLIIDPSYLPPESLRFFFIDPNWLDAYLDGALSVANHMEYGDGDDPIRRSIKMAINAYLKSTIPKLEYSPQVPSFGFLLRSEVVSRFPDLRVEVPLAAQTAKTGAPILMQRNIDKGTMFCLFENVPSTDGFDRLIFTQPPHQQSFIVGTELDEHELVIDYKRIYTRGSSTAEGVDRSEPLCPKVKWLKSDVSERPVFDWATRMLLFPAWSMDLLKKLEDFMPKDLSTTPPTPYFGEKYATSAIVGTQLNSPVNELAIVLAKNSRQWADLKTAKPPRLHMLKPWLKLRTRTRSSSAEAFSSVAVSTKRIKTEGAAFTAESRMRSDSIHVLTDNANLITTGPPPKRGVAKKPTFEFEVYTVDLLASEHDMGTIPTNVDYKQSLVFSIRLTNPKAGEYHLVELNVKIPMGKNDLNPGMNLMESYDGPGPSMLSNARFNVLLEYTAKSMILRAIPRNVPPEEHVSMISEISFMLKLVDVIDYQTTRTIPIVFTEKYLESEIRSEFPTSIDVVLFQRAVGR
ncbi:hypothetical protein CERZMDRAFT_32491 [Cercospora zeae-maydis SCOH1-5]|uniref:Uncharacterized protein n=1 Tax=Cercospora zeae-maydis SCOH1-5 TaxID=717836 RepID=A0A6A6FVJ9_9PEZI|nr:hypothetical protein CERZMDRAFT_32491 [Cercospora zeae-maydis SCOH1-5]